MIGNNRDGCVGAGPAVRVLHQWRRHPHHRLSGYPWQYPLPPTLHIQVFCNVPLQLKATQPQANNSTYRNSMQIT